jgi:hypothetical protein
VKGKRLSTRNYVFIIIVVAELVVALNGSYYLLSSAPPYVPTTNGSSNNADNQTTVNFDFDTGSPLLIEGQNTPLSLTVDGLTASFSSPSDSISPAFSIQSYQKTFLTLPQFSGKWLYDNKPSRDSLDIKFSQPLTSLTLTFAIVERQRSSGGKFNVTLTVSAHMNSTETTPIGSATATGAFSGALFPEGTLSFTSTGQSFNLVRIEIPSIFQGTTDFYVDNIKVIPLEQP